MLPEQKDLNGKRLEVFEKARLLITQNERQLVARTDAYKCYRNETM